MRLPEVPLAEVDLAWTPLDGFAFTPLPPLSLALSLATGFLRLLLARLMREGIVADVYQGPPGLKSPAARIVIRCESGALPSATTPPAAAPRRGDDRSGRA